MQFDNKIYWITFREASCGSFIALIISQLLWPERSQVEDFPQSAMADSTLNQMINDCRVIGGRTRNTEYPVFFPEARPHVNVSIPLHDAIMDLPYDEPELITLSHIPPDFIRCQSKFPNGHHLVITVSEKMMSRLYANFYYKCTTNQVFTNDQVQEMVKFQMGLYQRREVTHHVDLEPLWQAETRYDQETEQLIWRVDLWRIIHDSQQLLNELAEWVDRPVNDIAKQTWANYLARQKELLPWLDDQ